jgi:hypothetical protein
MDPRIYLYHTMTTEVPLGFLPSACRSFLDSRDPKYLLDSFQWNISLKGGDYWARIYNGYSDLTDEDIILLEGWILESTFFQ